MGKFTDRFTRRKPQRVDATPLGEAEVKMYTAVLVALEGAANSVRASLAASDLQTVERALEVVKQPEHAAALQAMVRGAIAGAAQAFTGSGKPPEQEPLPEGWPPGWDMDADDRGFFSTRNGAATALRYENPEDARRDAWERHQAENGEALTLVDPIEPGSPERGDVDVLRAAAGIAAQYGEADVEHAVANFADDLETAEREGYAYRSGGR